MKKFFFAFLLLPISGTMLIWLALTEMTPSIFGISTAEADEDKGEEDPFIDIDGHWAKYYIIRLYEDGVLSGYGDGRFGPDDEITRAQILKVALLTFGLPFLWEVEESAGFTDVSATEWYAEYVDRAAGVLEIVDGYSDNTFRPNNFVTRAEALKIILRAAGLDGTTGLTDFIASTYDPTDNFSDMDTINDWFAPYTAYAKAIGLVDGYGDDSFRGNQTMTRAEVCKIAIFMKNYMEALPNE